MTGEKGSTGETPAVADDRLGIDLGTTFTAAALARDGRVEPVALGGSHGTAIPTVVHLAGDRMLVGVDAARRATTEPELVVREFKRRVGDPTPLQVGGRPVAAEDLMARLVAWVVEQVSTSEGAPPRAVAVTHPANWGDHKRDLLRGALARAGARVDRLVPEPVAAAHYYAAQRRLAAGSVVAVYDLGGGTFDAAVVQIDGEGASCTIRGRPDGIERLGGIDFDEAVFGHVLRTLGLDADGLDPDDPATVAAVAGLRRSCVEAKEALSETGEVTIPVLLPGRHEQVRLARSELEAMIRPALDETIVALRRAVASAGVTVEDLTAILLVGGSSRIPLVEELVTAELGRPVATDARPKDAISMGAAFVAAQVDPDAPAPAATAAAPAPAPRPAPPSPVHTGPVPVVGPLGPVSTGPVPVVPGPVDTGPVPVAAPPPKRGRRRRGLVPVLVGVVLVVALATGVLVVGRGDSEPEAASPAGADDPAAAEPTDTTAADAPGDAGAAPVDPGDAEPEPGEEVRPIAETYDLSGVTVNLGWLNLSDQFLLANVTALALEEAGATVRADGPTMAAGAEALRDQLGEGEIDLFWDYMGRPAGVDDSDLPLEVPAAALQDRLNQLDAPNDLTWLDPAAYTLEHGLGVRRQDAQALEISSIADVDRLIVEDPEAASVCYVIEDQLRGLEASYGFRFTQPMFVPNPGEIYPRLAAGDCTFAVIPNAIHPAMAEEGLTLLEDNRSFFTPMNPAPRVPTELADEVPELGELLAELGGELDNETMSELVARVELGGEVPADVALDWLRSTGYLS